VKLKVPADVGVPAKAPLEAFNDSPGGSEPPVTAQVYGVAPPDAVIGCAYAAPTVPPGREAAVVIVSGGVLGAIVSANALVAEARFLSTTCTVKEKVFAVVGVPESVPLDAFNEMTPARVPAVTDHVYGAAPPATPSVCE